MSGSANWRRQRWAVEIGWRAWTNLLQICRRWSAHRWTHEGGGIRQVCRFPDGGRERPWRCQLATPRCKARLAAPMITFGKFAEGQSLAPPEGKSCQLARFRRWQLPMALVAPPEMQICTSEIAAVNPPTGGICRGGHRSAKLHNGVLPGGRRKIAHPRAAGQRGNPPIGGFLVSVIPKFTGSDSGIYEVSP